MSYVNKEKQAAASKRYYLKNIKKMKERATLFRDQSRLRNKQFVNEYKRSHPCVDCGEGNYIVLQFDHTDGDKEKEVSIAVNAGWSIDHLTKEISKCDIRCANCHIKRHHKIRTDK